MPSDHPKPDRCAASVVDKVGLEVHAESFEVPDSVDVDVDLEAVGARDDEDRHVLTDDVIHEVLLERDGETVEVEADYTTVIDYLRNGFEIDTVYHLADAVEIPITVADDDPYVSNARTDHQGYCLRYPMDNGRCYVHGGVSGGAPEGNTNAMTHGLKARRSNYYQSLDDEDKAFVEAMVDSWLDDAPFGRDNVAKVTELYRIGIDQHRLWRATDEYADEGLVTERVIGTDEKGAPIEADDENPMNMPYSRLDGDVYKKLKELGCLDDPESQKADAEMSLAKKLSGLDED